MSEKETVSLVDLVKEKSAGMVYSARECIDSGRKVLEVVGRRYCGLGEYCPLQGEVEGRALHICLRSDYHQELAERRKPHGDS